ncbi:MAG: hypothetical protein NPIRA01_14060 [Nitrospirales bacterium]|nr:MAG: hypothetical protein NPIRA01_14060 [Nitrospirales bacterium]
MPAGEMTIAGSNNLRVFEVSHGAGLVDCRAGTYLGFAIVDKNDTGATFTQHFYWTFEDKHVTIIIHFIQFIIVFAHSLFGILIALSIARISHFQHVTPT